MNFVGLGEMFKGDSAHTCPGKFPLTLMGCRAEGLACADPGARTPIGMSGNFSVAVVTEHIDSSKNSNEPALCVLRHAECFLLLKPTSIIS